MTKTQENCPFNPNQRVDADIDGKTECLTCLTVPALNELLERSDLSEEIKDKVRLALAIKEYKGKNGW